MPISNATTVNQTPASLVIAAFGGVRQTAKALGMNQGTVCRWRLPRDKGGTGGNVPSAAARLILRVARERGLALTADDLLVGR